MVNNLVIWGKPSIRRSHVLSSDHHIKQCKFKPRNGSIPNYNNVTSQSTRVATNKLMYPETRVRYVEATDVIKDKVEQTEDPWKSLCEETRKVATEVCGVTAYKSQTPWITESDEHMTILQLWRNERTRRWDEILQNEKLRDHFLSNFG